MAESALDNAIEEPRNQVAPPLTDLMYVDGETSASLAFPTAAEGAPVARTAVWLPQFWITLSVEPWRGKLLRPCLFRECWTIARPRRYANGWASPRESSR